MQLNCFDEGADRDDHLVACRNMIEPFHPIFADPDHVAATTETSNAIGLDRLFDARQALGQCGRLALFARGALFEIAGRDLFLDEDDLGLRFGNRRLKIFQRKEFMQDYLASLCIALAQIDTDAVQEAIQLLRATRDAGGTVFVAGNGGSAATSWWKWWPPT